MSASLKDPRINGGWREGGEVNLGTEGCEEPRREDHQSTETKEGTMCAGRIRRVCVCVCVSE